MPADDSAYQELHLNTATSNLISYQTLGIAKPPTRTSRFYVQFCYIQHLSFPFLSSSGNKGNISSSSKRFMKVFLRFKSDELQNYKNENNLKLLPFTEKILTILLISNNNEFTEAYLKVRSHHLFLPVSELSFGSSLKTQCFFFSPPPSLLALAWFCLAEFLRQ